ncbi:MAG: site-2 protease family protein [Lachnospiraceae bacterium]|nr:site-2 protease family protein [Lachnospiraceae bacterium]
MGIFLAILMFGVIVLIHELGHFTAAKLNGIKVHEFSLGLGPTLIGKQFKGTKFSLKLLPFGGACMMGEDEIGDDGLGSFNSKNVWRRISVIAAGAFLNLVTALILCIVLVAWIGFVPPVVGSLTAGGPAAEQGEIQAGDVILRLNHQRVRLWDDILLFNVMNVDGDPVDVTFMRDDVQHQVTITPVFVEDSSFPLLGLGSSARERAGFFDSFRYGFYTLQFWMNNTFQSLRMLVTGRMGIEDISGPVGIVQAVDQTYQASVYYGIGTVVRGLMSLGILLSVSLGIFNLLPLPALDGGRLIFLFLEAIRRKRVSPEREGIVHFVGIVLLLVLMVAVTFNDIRNLFA